MFWIKLLITLLDIFFIYNGLKLVLGTTGKVFDLMAIHVMNSKKWLVALMLVAIGAVLLAIVYPLTAMLDGHMAVDPILTGSSVMISYFLYQQDLV